MKAKQQNEFQSNYVTGPVILTDILVNPTAKELEDWSGWTIDKEPNYIITDDKGVISAQIKIYGKVLDNEKITVSWQFYISNKQLVSNPSDGSQPKYCFINSKGNTSWATSIDALPQWFKEDMPRLAYPGEEALGQFVAAFNNIVFKKDIKNVDTVLLDFPEKLFKGDFSELKQLNLFPTNKVQKIVGISEREGKFFHAVENAYTFKHWDTEPYMQSLKGKSTWEAVINYITKEDPRSRYNPHLITNEFKIWSSNELKEEFKKINMTEPQDEQMPQPPVTDNLPF